MLELQAKQKWRKRLYSRPIFVILLLMTVLGIKGTVNVYEKKLESEENLRKITEEVGAMRERELQLAAQIGRLETDQGVEEEIRKKFSVVKDGEQMVVLVDDESATSAPAEEEKGLLGRMWAAVTGVFGGGE